MQVIFGILMTFIGAASGLLFQDPVVCRFNESDQCYVAQGQELHLQIPLVFKFYLEMTDKTTNRSNIFKYRKNQSNSTPNLPGWQFNTETYTMILTSAESSDSGTYNLYTFTARGTDTGIFTLELHIEAEVSSVSVTYSCSISEDIKVYCSADGDDLTYSWTSDFNTLSQLENGTNTQTLSKEYQGKVTCYVKNHVSQNRNSTVVQPCYDPTTTATTGNVTTEIYRTTSTVLYTTNPTPRYGFLCFIVFLLVWIFEIIILLLLLVGTHLYIRNSRKERIIKNQDAL